MKRIANLKTIVFLAALLALFVLSACSEDDGSNAAENASKASGKTETLTMYIAEPWSAGNIDPSWTDPIAKEFTKRTGINLKISIANGQDPDGQLNVLMASDELPDLVFAARNRRTQLVSGGFIQPMNELIEQFGPNIKRNLSPYFDNWTESDGKIYGLGAWNWNKPTKYALNLEVNTLMMRYDILKEMGYAKLDRKNDGDSFITVDDYLKLLDEVKAKHPDLTPALMSAPGAYDALLTSKGLQRQGDTLYENGKAYFVYDNPYTEDIIKTLNKLYTGGYVPKGIAAFKQEENQALIASGKVFSSLGSVDGLYQAQAALSEGNDEKRMVMFYLIDNPEIKNVYVNGYYGIGPPNLMISKKSKHVEAAMKLLDYMSTEEGSLLLNAGVEGQTYTKDADGKNVPIPEIAKGYASWDTTVLKKYGVGGWFNIFPGMAGVDKDGNAYDINAQQTFDGNKWVTYNNADWKRFSYPQIVSTAGILSKDKQPDAFEASSKIQAYITDRMTKAVVASSPEAAAEEWSKAVAQMKSDGLDKLTMALGDNWMTLAKVLKRSPERLNVVDADQ